LKCIYCCLIFLHSKFENLNSKLI